MTAWIDIYWTQFRTQLAVQFQYRVAMFIWLMGIILEPIIYLVVWSTIASSEGGSVGEFTTNQFAAYYLVLMVVNHLTFSWVMWEYEHYVKEGILSGLLLRPIHPIHKDMAENLAFKALTMAGLAPTVLILGLVFRPEFDLSLWSSLAFIPALLLAMLLRLLLEWTLAMAAFWTTRVSAINQMYFVTFLFFSGRIAPLDLFPDFIQTLSYWLPFRWTVFFPVQLLTGRLSTVDFVIGLVFQVAWILASLILLSRVWRVGVRRFSAVGS